MGYSAAECLAQRRRTVRINLRIVRAARDGDIGHAAVEQILCGKFCIHLDQHPVCGLALAGMAGDGIAVIKMQAFGQVSLDCASTVQP